MARNIPIRVLRATRAALAAQAGASGLLAGEPYLITDENRLAVGTGTGAYAEAGMTGAANTWTAAQAFTAGMTGGAATVTLSSNAATIPLDGRVHVLDLDPATNNVSLTFSTPAGATYAAALIHVIQGSTSRSITWTNSPTSMDSQALPTTNNYKSYWVACTVDGGSSYTLSGAGAQSA